MKTSILALLWLLVAQGAAAQSLPAEARTVLERAVTIGDEARAVLDAHPVYRAVLPGHDLQAALNAGPADIRMCAGCVFSGGFVVPRPLSLMGDAGTELVGIGKQAIRTLPGVNDIALTRFSARSNHQTVVQLGDNVAATQGTLDLVPRRIILREIKVPTHRGKRAFEINAADVLMEDCEALDVYDVNADDQAIAILNTPGPFTARRGRFQSASENILAGGDTPKIAGVIPSDLVFEDLTLDKPQSWRRGSPTFDGIERRIKTLFELKTGRRVTVRRVRMDGSWKDDQDGWAIVITPRACGAVEDVFLEDLTVVNVASVLNLTGHDEPTNCATPFRTNQIRVFGGTFDAFKRVTGERGIFAMLSMGPADLTIENIAFRGNGNHFIYGPDTERIMLVRVVGSLATVGQWGLSFGGAANLTNISTVDQVDVVGNTFAGAASALRSRIPNNTYVDRPALDLLFAAR